MFLSLVLRGCKRMRLVRRAGTLALAVVVAQGVAPAGAQSNPEVSFTAWAGLDGYFKQGDWIPVRVELANDGAEAEVDLEVVPWPATSGRTGSYGLSLVLPSGGRKVAQLYAFPTTSTRSLRVRLRVGGRLMTESELRLIELSDAEALVGVMASNPTPFNVLRGSTAQGGGRRIEIAVLTVESLPDQAAALEALDALIIDDLDSGTLTLGQRQAVAFWVSSGGRLVVCGGPNWQRTTAGLNAVLPVEVTGTQRVAGLEDSGIYLGLGSGTQAETILALGSPIADARVLIAEGSLPVAVTRQTGLGHTTYLATDPTLAPLHDVASAQSMYGSLVFDPPFGPIGSWSLDDASAGEAAALFPNLTLPSISTVCVFLGLYTFALGPLHYLLLRKARRRELAWVTIPALVVVFTGVAFGVGSFTRGNRPVLNRLAVVRIAEGASRAQITGVMGVFSPSRRSVEVVFPSGVMARPLEAGYRLAEGDWSFQQTAEGSGVAEMRFDPASVRGFAFEGDASAPSASHNLSAEFTEASYQVRGQITSIDLHLEDAALLTPYGVIGLGDLNPGEPVPVSKDLRLGAGGDAYRQLAMALGTSGSGLPVDVAGRDEIDPIRRSRLIDSIPLAADGHLSPVTFLAGWSESAPLPVEVAGATAASDLTLYLFELRIPASGLTGLPSGATGVPQPLTLGTQPAGVAVLDPTDFDWVVLEADPPAPTPGPYGAQLSQGYYTLSFTPAYAIGDRPVQALTLHLEGDSRGAKLEELIWLWDFDAASWGVFAGLRWGDNRVPDPADHVGPGGEIRLRVETSGEGVSIVLRRSDFTMELGP